MTSYGERSTQETGVYIPNLWDLAQRAKDAYLGAFLDWDVVEWQKYPDKAFDYYMSHLYSMQSNKGWPPSLVQILRDNALDALAQSTTASQFWAMINHSENQIILYYGYSPSQLRNWSNHVAFLDSAGDAASSYREVLDEYAPHQQLGKQGSENIDDLKKFALIGLAVLVGVQVLK